MIVVTFTLSNKQARICEKFLQTRYKSKAGINRLAKIATLREVAEQAKKESEEAEKAIS
jgi:hypothetical protein